MFSKTKLPIDIFCIPISIRVLKFYFQIVFLANICRRSIEIYVDSFQSFKTVNFSIFQNKDQEQYRLYYKYYL